MPERGAGTADVIPKPCDPASALKGVGPKKAALLSSVGVKTAEDLLYAFPRTYEDRRNKARIAELAVGEAAGFEGRVLSVPGKPVHSPKGGKVPFSVLVGDGTGTVELIFFNAKYMERIFAAGRSFRFFGVPQTGKGRLRVVHPDFERAEASGAQLSHPIMPVYPLTAGLTQKELRRWHEAVLPVSAFVTEYLPESLRKRARLCGISHALANIHFPADRSALSAAKYRLVFEELLLLQTGLMRIGRGRRAAGESGAKVLRCSCRPSVQAFEKLLPYSLTNAQRRTIAEIYADMETDRPMNRLVQGDVGSGKTAVAMAAIFKAGRNGFQALMMAPTEILAKQHYRELRSTFDRAGNAAGALRVALLTAGVKAAERRDVLAGLASGEIDVAVGTHALLRPDVIFARPGLVITDEQHRFGVNQRIGLSQKGEAPHVLVMTATPIPRTLAFILCGDLDISRIDEMPPGRKRILTKVAGSAKRAEVYEFLRGELARGRQAYVVAPLIEEGADAAGKPGEPRSAERLRSELKQRFSEYEVASLHGGMKQDEKDRVMTDYVEGRIRVLVATVVIEVGVNVPNATVMIVENAERFGLAQLHQLRGRVGRGGEKSYCVLITDSASKVAAERARILTETDDGFLIAEKDLVMRGPGELFGVRQHGIPNLRIADPVRHVNILERVRREATLLLDADPRLEAPEHAAFRRRVDAMFREIAAAGM